MSTEERETVPAPPVESTNPIDVERKRNRYAILEQEPLERHCGFWGLEVVDGIARRVTPMIDEEVALLWLMRARSSVTYGSAFPEFCERRHLRETPGLCDTCLKGSSR